MAHSDGFFHFHLLCSAKALMDLDRLGTRQTVTPCNTIDILLFRVTLFQKHTKLRPPHSTFFDCATSPAYICLDGSVLQTARKVQFRKQTQLKCVCGACASPHVSAMARPFTLHRFLEFEMEAFVDLLCCFIKEVMVHRGDKDWKPQPLSSASSQVSARCACIT